MSKPPVVTAQQPELAYAFDQSMVSVNRPAAPLYAQQPPKACGLGIAGFVVSLFGVVPCLALVAPIGLLFSLIGLRKRPRGLAIAGTVLGVIGSSWIVLATALCVIGANVNAQKQEQAVARHARRIARFHPANIAVDDVAPLYALRFADGRKQHAQLAEWHLDGVREETVVDIDADGVEQVAVDWESQRAFALTRHELGRLSLDLGEFEEIEFDLDPPAMSWPKGVAIDSTRHRVVVMTSHVFQRFYAYEPPSGTWSRLPGEMRDTGLVGLAYAEPNDSLYSVQVSAGDNLLSTIRRFNAKGAATGTVTLSPAIPLQKDLSSEDRIQIKYASEKLLLILSPGLCSATTEVFAIDPTSGTVASATWAAPIPTFVGTATPEAAGGGIEPGEAVASQGSHPLGGQRVVGGNPEVRTKSVVSTKSVVRTKPAVRTKSAQGRSWDWGLPLVGGLALLVILASAHQLIFRQSKGAATRHTTAPAPPELQAISNSTESSRWGRALDVSFVVAALLYPTGCVAVAAIVRIDVAIGALLVMGLFVLVSALGGALGHFVYRSFKTPFTVLAVSFAFWSAAAVLLGLHSSIDANFFAGPLMGLANMRKLGSSGSIVFIGLLSLPILWPIFAHALRPGPRNAMVTVFGVAVWCLTGAISEW